MLYVKFFDQFTYGFKRNILIKILFYRFEFVKIIFRQRTCNYMKIAFIRIKI